jgi:hypothetical protein
MNNLQLIGVSLLVIIWWVGVWGCIETVVHAITRNNPIHAFITYFSMAVFVLACFIVCPSLFTKIMV